MTQDIGTIQLALKLYGDKEFNAFLGAAEEKVGKVKKATDALAESVRALNLLSGVGKAEGRAADNAGKTPENKSAGTEGKKGEEEKKKYTSWTEAVLGGLEKFAADAKDKAKVFEGLSKAVENSFTKMGDVVKTFLTTGKLEFSKLFESLVSDLMGVLVKPAITGPLASGAKWLLGGVFDFFGFARGGALSGAPGLSRYSGSIVDRPTFFPFAKGVGLMGEAGPEAILPLGRDASGRLGVRAAAGDEVAGATRQVVLESHIHLNASGGSAEQNANLAAQTSRAVEQTMRGLVRDELGRQLRQGGILSRNGGRI